jgi:hypothetical protein
MALGIDKLKKALGFILHLVNKVDELVEDEWQWLPDTVALLPSLIEIPGLIKDGKETWEQFKDLDADEREELIEYAKTEFDISDDEVEDIVEAAFDLLDAAADLYERIKALKDEE